MTTLDLAAFADVASDLVDARLRAGNAIRFTVPTGSMYPTLAPGDQVIVRAARAADLRPGDIVVVKAGDGARAAWVAHRLIARRAASLVTKGDNCAAADAPWTEAQLVGSVIAVRRQQSQRLTDFSSRRARSVGAFLAWLSRGQGFVHASLRGLPQRIALKASRILLRGSASAARFITG